MKLINVSQPAGQDIQRQIELIGTRMACENAKRLILEKVDTVVSILPQSRGLLSETNATKSVKNKEAL